MVDIFLIHEHVGHHTCPCLYMPLHIIKKKKCMEWAICQRSYTVYFKQKLGPSFIFSVCCSFPQNSTLISFHVGLLVLDWFIGTFLLLMMFASTFYFQLLLMSNIGCLEFFFCYDTDKSWVLNVIYVIYVFLVAQNCFDHWICYRKET